MKRNYLKYTLLIGATCSAFQVHAEINSTSQSKSIYDAPSCYNIPAHATSLVKLRVNLTANATIPTVSSFNPNDPNSYNYTNAITIYDSLGYRYKLSVYYVKSQANQWQAYVHINGKSAGVGKLVFTSSGTLASVTGLNNLKWKPTADELPLHVFTIDMTCTTQTGAPYNSDAGWTDGNAPGENFHAALPVNQVDAQRSCIFASPRATTVVKLNFNLNAADAMPATNPFDPNNSSSYNFVVQIPIYDSLGVLHQTKIYFIKKMMNTWDGHVYVDDAPLAIGHLWFNSNGQLTNLSGLNNLAWSPTSGASAPQLFSINVTCSTQYDSSDVLKEAPWQDGLAGGLNLV